MGEIKDDMSMIKNSIGRIKQRKKIRKLEGEINKQFEDKFKELALESGYRMARVRLVRSEEKTDY